MLPEEPHINVCKTVVSQFLWEQDQMNLGSVNPRGGRLRDALSHPTSSHAI